MNPSNPLDRDRRQPSEPSPAPPGDHAAAPSAPAPERRNPRPPFGPSPEPQGDAATPPPSALGAEAVPPAAHDRVPDGHAPVTATVATDAGSSGTATIRPVAEPARIESLDLLRGFALLGILLMNIIAFGFHSNVYFFPQTSLASAPDYVAWLGTELFAEGAMRCLFSMLFGAGVVIFTTGATAKGAWLHYKRNFWLLAIGLADAYLLLWSGDILLNYALAGFLLYFLRNVPARGLYAVAAALVLAISLFYSFVNRQLVQADDIVAEYRATGIRPTAEEMALVEDWYGLLAGQQPSPGEIAEELAERGGSAASAFAWNADSFTGTLQFGIPYFLLWDALAMMALGMALFKSGVLSGRLSKGAYGIMALAGFAVGGAINALEVSRAHASGFEVLATFPLVQFSYQYGRLGIAFGWLGLVLLAFKAGWLPNLRHCLAAVGRMALTNYLMHSLVFMIIFTGAGLGLVGSYGRAEAYVLVMAVWLFQLGFSPLWLARYRYGPVEWLWRGLTYSQYSSGFPTNRRREKS